MTNLADEHYDDGSTGANQVATSPQFQAESLQRFIADRDAQIAALTAALIHYRDHRDTGDDRCTYCTAEYSE